MKLEKNLSSSSFSWIIMHIWVLRQMTPFYVCRGYQLCRRNRGKRKLLRNWAGVLVKPWWFGASLLICRAHEYKSAATYTDSQHKCKRENDAGSRRRPVGFRTLSVIEHTERAVGPSPAPRSEVCSVFSLPSIPPSRWHQDSLTACPELSPLATLPHQVLSVPTVSIQRALCQAEPSKVVCVLVFSKGKSHRWWWIQLPIVYHYY